MGRLRAAVVAWVCVILIVLRLATGRPPMAVVGVAAVLGEGMRDTFGLTTSGSELPERRPPEPGARRCVSSVPLR